MQDNSEGTCDVQLKYTDSAYNEFPSANNSPENEDSRTQKKRLWNEESEQRLFEIWGRENWRLTRHGKNTVFFNHWAEELKEKYKVDVRGEEVQNKVNQLRAKFKKVKKEYAVCQNRTPWKKFTLIKQILSNQYRPTEAEPIPQEALDNNRDAELVDNIVEPVSVKSEQASVVTSVITTNKPFQSKGAQNANMNFNHCNSPNDTNNSLYAATANTNEVTPSYVSNTQYNEQFDNNEPKFGETYSSYDGFNGTPVYELTGEAPMHGHHILMQHEHQQQPQQTQQQAHVVMHSNEPQQQNYMAEPDPNQSLQQKKEHQQVLQQPQFAAIQQQQQSPHLVATPPVEHHNQHVVLSHQQVQPQQQQSYQNRHAMQTEESTDYQMLELGGTGGDSFQTVREKLPIVQSVQIIQPSEPFKYEMRPATNANYNQPPRENYMHLLYNNNNSNSNTSNTMAATMPASPTATYMTAPQQLPNTTSGATAISNGAMYNRTPNTSNNGNVNNNSPSTVSPAPRKRGRPPNQPAPDSLEAQYMQEIRRKHTLMEEGHVLTKQRNEIESRKLALLEKFLPKYLEQQKRLLSKFPSE